MATKVFVYNDEANEVELHYLEESDTMPYALEGSMTVGEFRGSSTSPTIWTYKGLMDCWNVLREQWGRPIGVRYAFKRIWEGGHGAQLLYL